MSGWWIAAGVGGIAALVILIFAWCTLFVGSRGDYPPDDDDGWGYGV